MAGREVETTSDLSRRRRKGSSMACSFDTTRPSASCRVRACVCVCARARSCLLVLSLSLTHSLTHSLCCEEISVSEGRESRSRLAKDAGGAAADAAELLVEVEPALEGPGGGGCLLSLYLYLYLSVCLSVSLRRGERLI